MVYSSMIDCRQPSNKGSKAERVELSAEKIRRKDAVGTFGLRFYVRYCYRSLPVVTFRARVRIILFGVSDFRGPFRVNDASRN